MEESSFPRHLAMIRECRCLEFDRRIYNVYTFLAAWQERKAYEDSE